MLGLVLTAGLGPCGAALAADDNWHLEQSAEQCTLAKYVATPAAMVMVQAEPGGSNMLVVAAPQLPRLPRTDVPPFSFPVDVLLDGAGRKVAANAMPGKLGGDYPAALRIAGLEWKDVVGIGDAQGLTVSFKGGTLGPLPLPKAKAAVAALADCVNGTLVDLGADPAQFAPGGEPPVALKPADKWFTSDQMLQMTRAAGPKGSDAGFRVVIDGEGKVESCAQARGAPNEALQKVACTPVLGKTLFKPAHDPAGKPVKGVTTFPVFMIMRVNFSSTSPVGF